MYFLLRDQKKQKSFVKLKIRPCISVSQATSMSPSCTSDTVIFKKFEMNKIDIEREAQ